MLTIRLGYCLWKSKCNQIQVAVAEAMELQMELELIPGGLWRAWITTWNPCHSEGVAIIILGIHGHTATLLGTDGRTTIAIIKLGAKLGESSAKLYLKFFTHDIMVKFLREEGEPRKIHTRIRSFGWGLIRIRYLPANLGLHQNITDDEKRVPQRFIWGRLWRASLLKYSERNKQNPEPYSN